MMLISKKGQLALAVIVGLLGSTLAGAVGSAGDAEVGKNMRVLYVGRPGTDREKDFVEFLSKHFGAVKTGDWAAFTESQCTGFDVTILDYDGSASKAPRLNLSKGFSHPVVTVGLPGAFVCSALRLKTAPQ
jgi:hypothetical protein